MSLSSQSIIILRRYKSIFCAWKLAILGALSIEEVRVMENNARQIIVERLDRQIQESCSHLETAGSLWEHVIEFQLSWFEGLRSH